jgi:hypothetical protein
MAGNPYEWNLTPLNNSVNGLSEMITQERQRRMQENTQNIINRKNEFELNRAVDLEKKLSRKANLGAILSARGVHPDDQKAFIGEMEAMGYATKGPAGIYEIEVRNIPEAFKTFNETPKAQMAVAQTRYGRLQNMVNQYGDEIAKLIEKDPFNYANDEKFKKANALKTQAENQMKEASEQLEKLQLLTDPKLRETQEEKALARQERRDLQRERLDATAEQNERDRQAKVDADKRHAELAMILKNMNQGRGPTEYQLMSASTNLRKEFNNRPEVKEYNQTMPKIASIDKALVEAQKSGNKVAADQALITLFNKMTDPNSVVRESEYARTPENLSFINKMQGKIAKLSTGGAGLTNADRQAIVNMAKQMQVAYQEVFDRTADEYSGYARGYGINPTMIVGERRSKPTAQAQNKGSDPLGLRK